MESLTLNHIATDQMIEIKNKTTMFENKRTAGHHLNINAIRDHHTTANIPKLSFVIQTRASDVKKKRINFH